MAAEVWQIIAVEYRIEPLGLLLGVVLQQGDSDATQRENGNDVYGGHEGGESICKRPDERHGTDSSANNAQDDQDAHGIQDSLALRQERDICFGVVVVAHQRGERKEEMITVTAWIAHVPTCADSAV